MKRLMFEAHQYNPADGTWHRQDLPGPSSFEAWWKCWLVFRCTLLLLKMVAPEPLDLYGEFIRRLSADAGPACWFLVALADTRMRAEMSERFRRGLAHFHKDTLAYPPGVTARYDDARPWEVIFALSVHPGFPEATAFWNAEVHQQRAAATETAAKACQKR